MADQHRRELERTAAQGDRTARRRLVAERVRAGELILQRPEADQEAWVRELLREGVLGANAVVRLVPREGQGPGPWDGRSWWWVEVMVGDPSGGWTVQLVRLSQRGARPLAKYDATSKARNSYRPLLPRPLGYSRDRVDAVAWFAENLLEVRLDPLPREEAFERDRRHTAQRAKRKARPRSWDPRVLLEEYAAFPEWHDQLSVHAPHLNEGRDLPRVLVARKGRRGVWHVVAQLTLRSVTPTCAKLPREDSFQGELAWAEPTCLRCRKKVEWESRHSGAGRRSECRKHQRQYLEWAARELEE